MRIVLLLLALLVGLWGLWPRRNPPPTGMEVSQLLGADASGYSKVLPGRILELPKDFAPHRDFKSEWWYLTGNLDFTGSPAPVGVGYQFTLFRQSTGIPFHGPRQSRWAARHGYMCHLAVSDFGAGRFHAQEKFRRESFEMAGSNSARVWLEDWVLQRLGSRYQLRAGDLDLELEPLKPVVFQGENGYSRKGPHPEEASYYYSLTRLHTTGTVRGQAVQGWSWFDREWSSRALPDGVVGWDWFSLQFEDGQELMYYQLRRSDGSATPESSGTWVDAKGVVTPLRGTLVPGRRWKTFPVEWQMELGEHRVSVKPRMDNQEWTGSVRYWEGGVEAVRSDGVRGRGYLELVGY